jgi:hypothetical protein
LRRRSQSHRKREVTTRFTSCRSAVAVPSSWGAAPSRKFIHPPYTSRNQPQLYVNNMVTRMSKFASSSLSGAILHRAWRRTIGNAVVLPTVPAQMKWRRKNGGMEHKDDRGQQTQTPMIWKMRGQRSNIHVSLTIAGVSELPTIMIIMQGVVTNRLIPPSCAKSDCGENHQCDMVLVVACCWRACGEGQQTADSTDSRCAPRSPTAWISGSG